MTNFKHFCAGCTFTALLFWATAFCPASKIYKFEEAMKDCKNIDACTLIAVPKKE